MNTQTVNNLQRRLNETWKEVKYIDNKVNGNKMSHQEAIVRLSTELRNVITIVNEIVDKF